MTYIGSKPANKPITSADIEDSIIVAADLAANSVDSSELVDGSIDTSHLADNQVTLAKMAGLARGKLIYGDTSGDPAALAVGAADEVLTHDGTDFDWAAAAGGGKVLQFVWATPVTANQSISTTTWTDVTGMTLDITPAATTSKIFVFAQTIVYCNDSGTDVGLSLRIDRDASVITSDIGGGYGVYSPEDNPRMQSNIMFYDAPSSTSALTYKIQAMTYSSRNAVLHESKDGYMYAYEIGA